MGKFDFSKSLLDLMPLCDEEHYNDDTEYMNLYEDWEYRNLLIKQREVANYGVSVLPVRMWNTNVESI